MKPLFRTILPPILIIGALIAAYVGTILAAHMSRIRFQSRLKNKVTSEELQAWGAKILAPFQTNADFDNLINSTNLHPAFKGLDKWSPTICVFARSEMTFNTSNPVPYVKVIYGSAAGHFGVLIGPTNLPTPASVPHEVKYDTWKPGVWFFDGQ